MGADYYIYSRSQRRVWELPRVMGGALWRDAPLWDADWNRCLDPAQATSIGIPWSDDLVVMSDIGIYPESLPWIDGDAPGALGQLREGWTKTALDVGPEWRTEPFLHFGEIPGENEAQHAAPLVGLSTEQSTGSAAFHQAVVEIGPGKRPEGGDVGLVGTVHDSVVFTTYPDDILFARVREKLAEAAFPKSLGLVGAAQLDLIAWKEPDQGPGEFWTYEDNDIAPVCPEATESAGDDEVLP